MVSSVTTASSTSTSSTSSAGAYDPLATANKVLKSLLKSDPLLESLVSQTSKYVPASYTRIAATLWGLLNTSGSSSITKADVQLAVFSVGEGSTSDIDALWNQLNPDKNTSISAGDFAKSEYLTTNINSMLTSVHEAIEELRLEQASTSGGSGSMLDFVSGHTGSVLDFFL